MNYKNDKLRNAIIHYVGRKNRLEPLHLSKKCLELDLEINRFLSTGFLQRFKHCFEYHSFSHPSSLKFNEVYQYCKQLFIDESSFEDVSVSIAKHLYDQSIHPKIKDGELYILYFEDIVVEGVTQKAIGIFKTENKSFFLEVKKGKDHFNLFMAEGVELSKMDKGCLILDQKAKDGFDVLIFDNQSRGEEAYYWREKFLQVSPQKNEFHHTSHLMSLTQKFISGPLISELHFDRKEQVELLNKSLDYFKNNDSFEIEEYKNQVFQDEDIIRSFQDFGSKYVTNAEYEIASSFEISNAAVKKQAKFFKRVIKLDKNFHIYIHGNKEMIEKGYDSKTGLNYYKIYYQEES